MAEDGERPLWGFGDLKSTFPFATAPFSWVQLINGGSFKFQKRILSERPRETRSLENADRVKKLVDRNPRLSTEEVASDLGQQFLTFWHIIFRCNFCSATGCPMNWALIQNFNQYGYEFLESNLFIHDETWVRWDSKTRREVWACKVDKKPTTQGSYSIAVIAVPRNIAKFAFSRDKSRNSSFSAINRDLAFLPR